MPEVAAIIYCIYTAPKQGLTEMQGQIHIWDSDLKALGQGSFSVGLREEL